MYHNDKLNKVKWTVKVTEQYTMPLLNKKMKTCFICHGIVPEKENKHLVKFKRIHRQWVNNIMWTQQCGIYFRVLRDVELNDKY